MALSSRRIALVCMTPASDANEHGDMELPSYGIRRILAAVLDDPALAGVQCGLIDVERPDVEAYVEAIESMEPDLVGFSVYVWSTPCLVEVARRIKRAARTASSFSVGRPRARRCSTCRLTAPAHAYARCAGCQRRRRYLPRNRPTAVPDTRRAAQRDRPRHAHPRRMGRIPGIGRRWSTWTRSPRPTSSA